MEDKREHAIAGWHTKKLGPTGCFNEITKVEYSWIITTGL